MYQVDLCKRKLKAIKQAELLMEYALVPDTVSITVPSEDLDIPMSTYAISHTVHLLLRIAVTLCDPVPASISSPMIR